MPSLHHFFSGTHHLVGSYATPPYIGFFRLISVQLHTVESLRPASYSYRCLPIAITWHLNTTDTMRVSVQLRTCPKTVRDYPIRSFRLQLVFTTKSLQGMAGMALLPSSSGDVHVQYIRDQRRLPAAFFCLTAVFLFI
ncbi:hypothetical protein I7I48_10524 [Histoplasma ohiense]|nr:hypothetical protein I7I48_10524 [Histoplasma ohiense (nom. inval.)]